MDSFNLEDHPHRRYNPLNGSWILVSPHRAKRPWQGQVEEITKEKKPTYDELYQKSRAVADYISGLVYWI